MRLTKCVHTSISIIDIWFRYMVTLKSESKEYVHSNRVLPSALRLTTVYNEFCMISSNFNFLQYAFSVYMVEYNIVHFHNAIFSFIRYSLWEYLSKTFILCVFVATACICTVLYISMK